MPFHLELEAMATGVWAWLDKNPGKIAEKRVRAIYRKAQKLTLEEFAQKGLAGKPEVSIKHRFSQSYGQRVTPRSEPYTERVRKFYGGRYLPFTSPTRNGTGNAGHLREAIRRPGGYRVAARNGTEIVTTSLYLGAARGLNFHPHYRREFLALDGMNRADAAAIEARVQEIALEMLTTEIARVERRQVKLQKQQQAGESP